VPDGRLGHLLRRSRPPGCPHLQQESLSLSHAVSIALSTLFQHKLKRQRQG